MQQIKPLELKSLLASGRKVVLIDVRQPEEFEIVHLPGAKLMPLGLLSERLEELRSFLKEQHDEVVVYCRIGGRGAQAAVWLEGQGIKGLINLAGGIDAYAKEADPALARY